MAQLRGTLQAAGGLSTGRARVCRRNGAPRAAGSASVHIKKAREGYGQAEAARSPVSASSGHVAGASVQLVPSRPFCGPARVVAGNCKRAPSSRRGSRGPSTKKLNSVLTLKKWPEEFHALSPVTERRRRTTLEPSDNALTSSPAPDEERDIHKESTNSLK